MRRPTREVEHELQMIPAQPGFRARYTDLDAGNEPRYCTQPVVLWVLAEIRIVDAETDEEVEKPTRAILPYGVTDLGVERLDKAGNFDRILSPEDPDDYALDETP